MATMVAYTALELTEAQKRALCAGVEKGASEAFEIDISITELMLMPTIPPECHGPRRHRTDHLFRLYRAQ